MEDNRSAEQRFTFGLICEVRDVLKAHGFEVGHIETQQALYAAIFDPRYPGRV